MADVDDGEALNVRVEEFAHFLEVAQDVIVFELRQLRARFPSLSPSQWVAAVRRWVLGGRGSLVRRLADAAPLFEDGRVFRHAVARDSRGDADDNEVKVASLADVVSINDPLNCSLFENPTIKQRCTQWGLVGSPSVPSSMAVVRRESRCGRVSSPDFRDFEGPQPASSTFIGDATVEPSAAQTTLVDAGEVAEMKNEIQLLKEQIALILQARQAPPPPGPPTATNGGDSDSGISNADEGGPSKAVAAPPPPPPPPPPGLLKKAFATPKVPRKAPSAPRTPVAEKENATPAGRPFLCDIPGAALRLKPAKDRVLAPRTPLDGPKDAGDYLMEALGRVFAANNRNIAEEALEGSPGADWSPESTPPPKKSARRRSSLAQQPLTPLGQNGGNVPKNA